MIPKTSTYTFSFLRYWNQKKGLLPSEKSYFLQRSRYYKVLVPHKICFGEKKLQKPYSLLV